MEEFEYNCSITALKEDEFPMLSGSNFIPYIHGEEYITEHTNFANALFLWGIYRKTPLSFSLLFGNHSHKLNK